MFAFASLRSWKNRGGQRSESCRWSDNCFVSVLLPIYNEPNVVDRLLKACTSFHSPPYEVVVVDDSDDNLTTDRLRTWENHANVKVVHRGSRKGWKGGALNVALDSIDPRSSHVLIFDADFVPPSDLVSRFVTKFEGLGDDRVVAVQGYQRHVLNADENWITKGVRVWHSLYNLVELNGQSQLGMSSLLTGCVFMIKTDVLRKFGFGEVTTEDTELTFRLRENGCKVVFDPSLAAPGECPSTLRRLFKQQTRWAEGHTRIFRDHFLKILMNRHIGLRDKMNFMFIGFAFLNSVLVVGLSIAWLFTCLFPAYFLPQVLMQASLLLFLASVPSGLFASFVALTLEDSKEDFSKIGHAWLLNFIMSPIVAYAALKGLLTKKGYFSRTYKTGKMMRRLQKDAESGKAEAVVRCGLLKERDRNGVADVIGASHQAGGSEIQRDTVVSVVLPAHNEAEIIGNIVPSYYREICLKLPAEIVVAEDGSTDGTREILSSLKSDLPLVLLADHNRKGYAKGVSDALRNCSSEWVFFSDSDGQYSPSDFWTLWKQRDDYDMIIGCKTHRKEPAYRIVLAKGFHKVMNCLFGLSLNDADCGFRLIRKEVIHSLIDNVRFLKYSFWAEFTIKACLKGFRVSEVPINHNSRIYGYSHIYKPTKVPMVVLKQLVGLARLYTDVKNGH